MRKQTIIKILENNGFTVVYEKDGSFLIQQYTPAGEDWGLHFSCVDDLCIYAENYDPEDDFVMWLDARKRDKSVPSIPELWQDQLWKRDTLRAVKEQIEEKENK